MEQLNKVKLIGVIGNIKIQTVDGNRFASLSMATNYAYKDRNGCPVIETTWHNVKAWEGRRISLDGLEKGAYAKITGRIRNQKYTDSSGVERYQTEILANSLEKIENEIPKYQL